MSLIERLLFESRNFEDTLPGGGLAERIAANAKRTTTSGGGTGTTSGGTHFSGTISHSSSSGGSSSSPDVIKGQKVIIYG